jgi:mRNA interferase MazF
MDAVCAAVTSAVPRSPRDVALLEWQASGLRVASTVRLSRLDCLEQSVLIGRVGVITQTDGKRIVDAWNKHINLQF